jgi:hypothetical protein
MDFKAEKNYLIQNTREAEITQGATSLTQRTCNTDVLVPCALHTPTQGQQIDVQTSRSWTKQQ